MAEVRINQLQGLSQVSPWGDLTYTFTTFGPWEASWVMTPGDWGLQTGDRIDIFDGLHCIWSGTLTEPNLDTGEYRADGAARLAEQFYALTAGGNISGTISGAVDQAIARGLAWAGRDAASTTSGAFLDTSTLTEPMRLSAYLDMYAEGIGQRWYVAPDRILRIADDPTTPKWRLHAGVARIGRGDQDFTTQMVARYLDSATSTYKTVTVASGTGGAFREELLDLTTRGPLTTAAATALAQKVLKVSATRPGLLEPVDVDAATLTDMGGNPADVRLIRGRDMVRIPGVWDGPLPHLDVVLGQVTVNDTTGVATLSEVDQAPRDLASVLAAIQNKPKHKK